MATCRGSGAVSGDFTASEPLFLDCILERQSNASDIEGFPVTPQKTALIFGISGQDGAYLAEHLLKQGIVVHGTARDKDSSNLSGLRQLRILDRITLHSTILNEFRSVATVLANVRPDLIFNLAAQSSVGLSFSQPVETIDSIMHGTINIMEAMRFLSLDARFYSASSSECFGSTEGEPAGETTPFHPRSPYAVGKAAAFWAVANYREAYGLFACSGILFNHESPLRPERYVTQKVVRGVMDIVEGKKSILELGLLNLERDWGWAPEYVVAMHKMLENDEPKDFVIATGETNSLQEFVAHCFACHDLDWQQHVTKNEEFVRPSDIASSCADPSKAREILGWSAETKMHGVIDRLLKAEAARRNQ
jgi:GDPmannose 4,6-dehydratase